MPQSRYFCLLYVYFCKIYQCIKVKCFKLVSILLKLLNKARLFVPTYLHKSTKNGLLFLMLISKHKITVHKYFTLCKKVKGVIKNTNSFKVGIF